MPIRKFCDNFINYYLVLIVQPKNMHQAAYHNDITRLALLIKRGVNIDIKYTNSGDTPLHIAAKKGNVQAVELLLKNGANPEILNYQNKTPIDLAKQQEILYCKKTNNIPQNYSKIIDILYNYLDTMPNLANQQCMKDSRQELLCSPMLNKLESELLNIKEYQHPVGTAQDQLFHDINNNISKKDSEIKKDLIPLNTERPVLNLNRVDSCISINYIDEDDELIIDETNLNIVSPHDELNYTIFALGVDITSTPIL